MDSKHYNILFSFSLSVTITFCISLNEASCIHRFWLAGMTKEITFWNGPYLISMTQTASLYSSDAFLLCKTSYVIKEKKKSYYDQSRNLYWKWKFLNFTMKKNKKRWFFFRRKKSSFRNSFMNLTLQTIIIEHNFYRSSNIFPPQKNRAIESILYFI